MKNITATALILLMLLTMTACDSDKSQKTEKPSDEVSAPETETENNSNQQTTKPVDQDSNPENNEPPQQITINGNVLTYQSTDSTDPKYPIDRYTDEQQGEYQFCRCGRPLKYRNKTPYEVTDVIVTKEQAIEKADTYLSGCYGEFFEGMDLYEYGYEGSREFGGQIHITYLRWSNEDRFLHLNSLLFYLGHNGTVLGYDFIYHDHVVEALTAEELNRIKKSDVEAYIDDIIQTDPKQLYQNITREALSVWHRLISKDGKAFVEISISGTGIGQEEYYYELPNSK